MNSNTIIPYVFGENTIRTTNSSGEPQFVIADLCKALEHSNPTMMLEKLHPDDLSTAEVVDSMGRMQTVNVCNESGLYHLIFQSRKPLAKEFTRWVTKDVLPSIRKRGFFGRREQAVTMFVRELLDMGLAPRDAARLALASFPALSRHEVRMQELREANENALAHEEQLNPENEIFLLEMRPGGCYTMKDFRAMLPARPPLTKLSAGAWNSTIGKSLRQLVRLGKIVKTANLRTATYSLAAALDKIVPMER